LFKCKTNKEELKTLSKVGLTREVDLIRVIEAKATKTGAVVIITIIVSSSKTQIMTMNKGDSS